MLSIGKLGEGQADYYLQSVAKGIEDYYAGEGEAPGQWMGAAATELEIAGEVKGELLHRALSGKHPATGAQLARPPRGAIRVTGFDLTFSAPKSVSLLYALGDPDASMAAREAHEAAVTAALGYMERHAAVGRRGRGGAQRVLGNGFLGAAFRHRTSRAGDPQLHTHVLVANMTRGPDDRWTALDGRQLYLHAKTGGYLYQAHLRAELTRRLGVEWTPVRHGVSDIAGIPTPVLRAFSRRRSEIEQRLAERGERSGRAAQVAALDTRQAKDYAVDAGTLRDGWWARAEALGLAPEDVRSLVRQTGWRPLNPSEIASGHEALADAEGLTEHRSTFVRRDVIQAWCEQLPAGDEVAQVEALADEFLASDEAVPLAADVDAATTSDVIRRADGRLVRGSSDERPHSTPELLALERGLIQAALARQDEQTAMVEPDVVERALAARPTLAEEQADMIRELTTGGAGVALVVGKAGTGKTFALDAAREAWQAQGYEVIGAALARRAARELQDGSGIDSTSVAALLADLREYGLPNDGRTVLVIDEAGMVGTRQLAELFDHASRSRSKVVLVGDDRQLPEIDAGGAFRGLLTRLPPIELAHNRRQEQAWERDALELLRAGRAEDALARYHSHDRVVLGDNACEVHQRLVGDWWDAVKSGDPAVMIAARRDDVRNLNGIARALMTAEGKLGSETLDIDGQVFSVGDQVIALKNARRLGIVNGTRGVVTAVDLEHRELVLATPDGGELHLPSSYLDDRTSRGGPTVDHGYAITGHKAQGMTTGRAFVLGTEELYREWGYVALSRGRKENRLYVVAPEPPERDEIAPPEPRREALDALTEGLRRSWAQRMAIDVEEDRAIAHLGTPELRRQRDALAGQLPTSQTVQRLRRQLDTIVSQREEAEGAAPASPSGAFRDQAQERVAQLVDRERSLRDRLEELAAPRAAADAGRLAAIERELRQRRETTVRAAVARPGEHLLAELGPLPDRPRERHEWRQAVRVIETYRYDHNVEDPTSPLGPEPPDAAGRQQWRAAHRRLEALRCTQERDQPELPSVGERGLG